MEIPEKHQISLYLVHLSYINRRYYILMLYCLWLMFNNVVKAYFMFEEQEISQLKDTTNWKVLILSILYPVVYIPSLIVSTIIFNAYSIRVGITIAVIFQGIGTILNWLLYLSIDCLIVGHTLWAIANPMLISCIACIPALWFEESKRIMTITLSWVCILIGNTIGYFFPKVIQLFGYQYGVLLSCSVLAISGVILAILVLFTFQGEPEQPPSCMATVDRDDDIIGTIRLLLIDKAFLKVTFTLSLYYIVFLTTRSNIFVLLKDFWLIIEHSWVFVIAFRVGGIIGSICAGITLHKYRWYK